MIDLKKAISKMSYNPADGKFTWIVNRGHCRAGEIAHGRKDKDGYVLLCGWRAHRLAWAFVHGSPPSGEIDHINGVRDDNRISNLRDVSRMVNAQNRNIRVRENGRLAGAHFVNEWKKPKPWRASIRINGKPKWLGCFKTEIEAHEAYVKVRDAMRDELLRAVSE